MEKIKPRTLSGFMELLPQRQMQMERFMEVLRESYSLYGFTPLDTPVIEAAQVLLAKGGGDVVCRFEGKGDRAFALDFLVGAGGRREIGYGSAENGCLAGGEELRSGFIHLLRALHVCAVNVGVEGRQLYRSSHQLHLCPVQRTGFG